MLSLTTGTCKEKCPNSDSHGPPYSILVEANLATTGMNMEGRLNSSFAIIRSSMRSHDMLMTYSDSYVHCHVASLTLNALRNVRRTQWRCVIVSASQYQYRSRKDLPLVL